jgi:hypothetical protein
MLSWRLHSLGGNSRVQSSPVVMMWVGSGREVGRMPSRVKIAPQARARQVESARVELELWTDCDHKRSEITPEAVGIITSRCACASCDISSPYLYSLANQDVSSYQLSRLDTSSWLAGAGTLQDTKLRDDKVCSLHIPRPSPDPPVCQETLEESFTSPVLQAAAQQV